ncbi:MAG: AAA family ATPase [Chloroflexi bacterium]|nr:AAA family ATPase [Chloroflexota bacterium]
MFRAVLGAPALLCLDEPYNFLDPNSREEIATILNDAEIGRKTQLVVSSHYEEDFFGAVKEEFIFDGLLPVRALEQRGATV